MSEITECLLNINYYTQPHVYKMLSEEQKVYDYCIRHGAGTNLGMLREHRGYIAAVIKIPSEVCDQFFFKYPNEIAFDPETHLIWVKRFYQEANFGFNDPIRILKKNKKTKEIEEKIDWYAFKRKVAFINKITKELREFPLKKGINPNHPFFDQYILYNKELFEKLNNEVKSIPKNRVNLDKILSKIKSS